MSHPSHPVLHMPRITRDETGGQSIVKLLEDDWTNPFDSNESEFVGISTGTLTPPDVARDILDAHKMAWQHTKNSSETGLKNKDQMLSSMTKQR